jgi:hypothetical protein
MALSKDGIDKLEKIMRANGKYFYDQQEFGVAGECGTTLCAAGFARLLKVGAIKLNAEVKAHSACFDISFAVACERDGAELLGIDAEIDEHSDLLEVFDSPKYWPEDILEAYNAAPNAQEKITVYIQMLRTRANDDGSIREQP